MADAPADPVQPPRSRGHLIVRAQAGLGNRLSALLSSLVIADLLQARLTIVWPSRDLACFGHFTALFEPLELPHLRFQDETPDMVWTDARHFPGDRLRAAMNAGETIFIAAYTIYGYELKPGWEFFEDCRKYLRQLRPVPEIRALIDRAMAASIGVHVRLSDHFPCQYLTPRWCYRVALEVITVRFPEKKIFVCSDTKEVVDELEARFPANLVTSPARHLASLKVRGTLEGSRAAVADLWILAHCPVVISTALSSFAVTARDLGGGLTHFIAKVSNPSKFRRTQLAWKVQSFIFRDLATDRWIASPELKTRRQRLAAKFVVMLANYVSSPRFQDRPSKSARRNFEKRLQHFLDSPECQKALNQPR